MALFPWSPVSSWVRPSGSGPHSSTAHDPRPAAIIRLRPNGGPLAAITGLFHALGNLKSPSGGDAVPARACRATPSRVLVSSLRRAEHHHTKPWKKKTRSHGKNKKSRTLRSMTAPRHAIIVVIELLVTGDFRSSTSAGGGCQISIFDFHAPGMKRRTWNQGHFTGAPLKLNRVPAARVWLQLGSCRVGLRGDRPQLNGTGGAGPNSFPDKPHTSNCKREDSETAQRSREERRARGERRPFLIAHCP
jgi:hypothetical protein